MLLISMIGDLGFQFYMLPKGKKFGDWTSEYLEYRLIGINLQLQMPVDMQIEG